MIWLSVVGYLYINFVSVTSTSVFSDATETVVIQLQGSHVGWQHKKMNSTNWPAPNVWVFIAQLVQHCSANVEAMGSNPVEVTNFFFWRLFEIA